MLQPSVVLEKAAWLESHNRIPMAKWRIFLRQPWFHASDKTEKKYFTNLKIAAMKVFHIM